MRRSFRLRLGRFRFLIPRTLLLFAFFFTAAIIIGVVFHQSVGHSPTPSPPPQVAVKNEIPIEAVELIPPLQVGSNCVSFRIHFREVRLKRITSFLSVVFLSNIVEFTFSEDSLSINGSDKARQKIVSFVIPVAGEYRVTFKWGNQRVSVIRYDVTFFERLLPGQSSLICYGEKYESRWCRATNICWRDRWFTFFGVGQTLFNRTIMTPGSRPIPNDYPSCRKCVRFHTTPEGFPYEDAVEVVPQLSYITCRWYSMQYLWHALFDYTLPLFWTEKLNGGVNRSSRIFLIDENTSKKGYQFLAAFTLHEVPNIKVNEIQHNNTCWQNVVLGFPKSELNVTPEKWDLSNLRLPYEYPLEAYMGFREHMISHYCGPEVMEKSCEPDPTNPRVMVMFRNTTGRDIVNQKELMTALKGWCPHCRVDSFTYANQSYCEQMSYCCNGSILISMHGSQLSHMVWMKVGDPQKRTAVIEILPYMYTCRDWYEQIANGAQIRYFQWVNTHRNNTWSGRGKGEAHDYERCLAGEMPCLGECHDLLRDQPTIVNLTEFEAVFRSSLDYVYKG